MAVTLKIKVLKYRLDYKFRFGPASIFARFKTPRRAQDPKCLRASPVTSRQL